MLKTFSHLHLCPDTLSHDQFLVIISSIAFLTGCYLNCLILWYPIIFKIIHHHCLLPFIFVQSTFWVDCSSPSHSWLLCAFSGELVNFLCTTGWHRPLNQHRMFGKLSSVKLAVGFDQCVTVFLFLLQHWPHLAQHFFPNRSAFVLLSLLFYNEKLLDFYLTQINLNFFTSKEALFFLPYCRTLLQSRHSWPTGAELHASVPANLSAIHVFTPTRWVNCPTQELNSVYLWQPGLKPDFQFFGLIWIILLNKRKQPRSSFFTLCIIKYL